MDLKWAFLSYLLVSAECVSSELHWTDFFKNRFLLLGLFLFVKKGEVGRWLSVEYVECRVCEEKAHVKPDVPTM